MFRRKAKGFTLVEVLITLAILGIILTVIFTFFLTNYKTLNKAQIEIELQSEGDKVINKISNVAIQCSAMNLYILNDDGTITLNDVGTIDSESEYIEFIGKESNKFTLDSSKKLFLDGVELGQFIEYIACTKITNGVELEIKLRNKDIEKFISTTIYFRNAM